MPNNNAKLLLFDAGIVEQLLERRVFESDEARLFSP